MPWSTCASRSTRHHHRCWACAKPLQGRRENFAVAGGDECFAWLGWLGWCCSPLIESCWHCEHWTCLSMVGMLRCPARDDNCSLIYKNRLICQRDIANYQSTPFMDISGWHKIPMSQLCSLSSTKENRLVGGFSPLKHKLTPRFGKHVEKKHTSEPVWPPCLWTLHIHTCAIGSSKAACNTRRWAPSCVGETLNDNVISEL